MKINNINIQTDGYIRCKSIFYSAEDLLSNRDCYTFKLGINKLIGEIDSGIWAISYLLSMYKRRSKDFIILKDPLITINSESVTLDELNKISCYMDRSYPLFSRNRPVRTLIKQGIARSGLNYTCEDIRDLFCIHPERFERPIHSIGNEIFKAMAAIGYSNGKEIFCFPWLSHKRFYGYHRHLSCLLEILEKLDKIAIVPVGTQ